MTRAKQFKYRVLNTCSVALPFPLLETAQVRGPRDHRALAAADGKVVIVWGKPHARDTTIFRTMAHHLMGECVSA